MGRLLPSPHQGICIFLDLVAGWTAQLIDKKEYFIQTDIPQLPDQESQQMSLFDFAAFNQPAQAEGTAQPSIFPHPALPQQVIDEALCIGANDQNSRLIICAYFKKDKPDNARFLSEHYGENGAGFYLDGRQYAIWYNAEGIRIAQGESAQRSSAIHISWEQAAARIRELLDLGRYMPQSELDRVDGYERQQRAAQLWYLRQDFAEGTAEAGFLPTVNAIYNTHQGFPEESAAIQGLLNHPEALQTIRDELEQFVQAYERTGNCCGSTSTARENFWNSFPTAAGTAALYRRRRVRPPAAIFHFRGRDRQSSAWWKTQHPITGWPCILSIATTRSAKNGRLS